MKSKVKQNSSRVPKRKGKAGSVREPLAFISSPAGRTLTRHLLDMVTTEISILRSNPLVVFRLNSEIIPYFFTWLLEESILLVRWSCFDSATWLEGCVGPKRDMGRFQPIWELAMVRQAICRIGSFLRVAKPAGLSAEEYWAELTTYFV